jgi:hypothetical protein
MLVDSCLAVRKYACDEAEWVWWYKAEQVYFSLHGYAARVPLCTLRTSW